MKTKSLIAALCLFAGAQSAYAQVLNRVEYFIDADPGVGNATTVLGVDSDDLISGNFQVPTVGFLQGFHYLGVRTQNELGGWSTNIASTFYLGSFLGQATAEIVQAEYFIDSDPGLGNGLPITISSGLIVNAAFGVDMTGLSQGFHKLSVRTKDENGAWTLNLSSTFYLLLSSSFTQNDVSEAEYFIDSDPGVGAGIAITISPGQTTSAAINIPVASLSNGFHKLGIRVKDSGSSWSNHLSSLFYTDAAVDLSNDQLASAEYFIDTDPGVGNGIAIETGGVNNVLTLDISASTATLPIGFHKLSVRTKTIAGQWSLQISSPFYLAALNNSAVQPIVAAEWYVDQDPGVGNGFSIAISEGNLLNEVAALDLSALNLVEDDHVLVVRVQNAAGAWSLHLAAPFEICESQSSPSFTVQTGCAGQPTLFSNTSTNVPEGSTFEWDFNNDGIVDATGTESESFSYASGGSFTARLRVVEPNCANSVTALVTVPSATTPVITVAGGNTTVCAAGTVQLTSTAATSYLWSNGATTQSTQVEAGNFTVTTTNAQGCTATSAVIALEFLPIDDCGECYADGESDPEWNTTCNDCAGVLAGSAAIDLCGVCAGGSTGIIPNASCSDCAGVANGTASVDGCGVCAGGTTGIVPNSTCSDCAGIIGGTASIDACGLCTGGNTGLVPDASCTDCAGVLFGTAAIDACGICSGGNTGLVANATCTDCAGVPNGLASLDECGLCSGGTTGLITNASCSDCNGVPNGAATPGTPCTLNGQAGVFTDGCICAIPLPDLAVSTVASDLASYGPGDPAQVTFNVSNTGVAAISKSWTERIFIQSATGLNRTLINQSAFSESGNLAPNDVISRTASITLPALLTVGASGVFVVEITPSPLTNELSVSNNIGVQPTSWSIEKVLQFTAASASLTEGNSASASITRSGALGSLLVVTLATPSPDRLELPATINFLAGQSTRSFTYTALDNADVEAPFLSTISASAATFESATLNVTVLNNDIPSLTIEELPATASEGDVIEFLVGSDLAVSTALTVFLTSSSPSRFPLPLSVTIPAGSASVAVSVTVPSNSIPQLDQEILINAGAAGNNPTTATIMLLDDDLPGLQLIIDTDTISESNGFFATTGRLVRLEGSNPSAFTANLNASIPNTLIIPNSISLAANEQEKVFNIGVVDNSLNEGFRTVNLTAAIFISSCGCSAPPSTSGFVSAEVVVADNDGPSLTLTVNPSALPEGLANAGTLKVSRNTGTSGTTTVNLSSSNLQEITLPATATIPNGSTFVDVPITTINDGIPDGTKTVVIQASAPGFSPGVITALVTDINKPDFLISSANIANPIVNSLTAVGYNIVVQNSGLASGLSGLVVEAYLSPNAILDSSDPVVVSTAINQTIGIGQSIPLSGFFLAPNTPGSFFLIFRVNPANAISELNFNNNISPLIPIAISPDYTATATIVPDFVTQGTPVTVSGIATNSDGSPAANKDVEVFILNGLSRREIIGTTNTLGAYSVNFQPLTTESGHYTAGASFPGFGSTLTQDNFDILGVRINNGALPQFSVVLGDTLQGALTVQNLSETSLTEFTILPVNLPLGAIIEFDTLAILSGLETASINYSVRGTLPSQGGNFLGAFLEVQAVEGSIQPFDCFYYCLSPSALLSTGISGINTTVSAAAGFTQVEFYLRNFGSGASGAVSLGLPQVDWLTSVTPLSIPSIAPGDSSLVVLKFLASESIPFNTPVSSTVVFNPQFGSGISLPFTFQKVSQSTSDLRVDVVNQFTYFSEGSPQVEGANVVISNFFTSEIYAQGLTDVDGVFIAADLPQGTHRISVTKDQHLPFEGTVVISPGIENTKTVFINFQAVTFSWSVVPTGIEDQYDITLITQFQTNVPIPVVTISVPDTFPELFGDEIFAFNVVLTNHGLIGANDVQFGLPENDPDYEFVYNYQPANLSALSSIQVPVVMRRRLEPLGGEFTGASLNNVSQFLGMNQSAIPSLANGGGNCKEFASVIYWYYCSFTTGLWQQGGVLFTFAGRTCPSNVNLGTGSDPSVFTGTLGCADCPVFPINPGSGGSFQYQIQPKTCVECLLDILGAANDCGNGPFGPLLDALGEANDAFGPQLNDEEGGFGLDDAEDAFDAVVCVSEAESVGDLIGCAPIPTPPIFDCLSSIGGAILTCLGTSTAGSFGDGPSLSQNAGSMNPAAAFNNSVNPGLNDLEGFNGIPEIFSQYVQDFEVAQNAYLVREQWAVAYFGDMIEADGFRFFIELIEASISDYQPIPQGLQESILIQTSGFDISQESQQLFFDRWNASLAAWSLGVLEPNEENPAIISRVEIKQYSDSLIAANEYAVGRGFEGGIAEMIAQNVFDILEQGNSSSDAVCAQITIQLSQQLTMTREAFIGTFTVFNGHPTDPVDSLSINIQILDGNGVPSNGLFQIETQNFINLNNVSGTGMVAAQEEGGVNYLFIPTIEAAPTAPIVYGFGGSVSYYDPYQSAMITLPLSPVFLTVNPSPNLVLNYFLQRDVLSDDALTEDVVEPTIPSELAVMVENRGFGPAVNMVISSAQPEIVANESGLAIDFNLIGSNLQGQPASLGLTNIVFGTIPPLTSRVGQWYFTSSLLGKFVSYEASVVHNNSFGNPALSLIQDVFLRELIHSIEVYGDEADGVDDFLVNDVFDTDNVPDIIYLSQGVITKPVVPADAANFNQAVVQPSFTNTLTVTPAEEGWNFVRINDPGNGEFDIVSVTRSDGQEIPLKNAWLTFVTLPVNLPPVYEDKFNFVDDFEDVEPVTYTIVWSPKNFDVPEVIAFQGVPAGVSDVQVTDITVVFNKPIDLSSFDFNDLNLISQGSPVALDESIIITQIDPVTFQINFGDATLGNGFYLLTVQAAGITDIFGVNGLEGQQTSWLQFIDVPAVLAFEGIPANSTAVAFETIEVVFNLPIDPVSLSPERFSIFLGAELQTGAVMIDSLSSDGKRAYLSNLGSIIVSDGTYQLLVDMENIVSVDQIPGIESQGVELIKDSQGPLAATLSLNNSGGLDSQHFPFVDIDFGEDILGFTIADVSLVRNGDPVQLTFTQLAIITQSIWKGGNFQFETYVEGDYTFSINLSGITDTGGNAGAGVASISWTVDRSNVIEVSNLGISPDKGFSPTDGVTSGLAFNVVFDLSAAATQVTISQIDFGAELVLLNLQNLGEGNHSIPVVFPTGGSTAVKVTAIGENGISGSQSKVLFIDQAPLTATWQLTSGQVIAEQLASILLQFGSPLLNPSDIESALSFKRNGALLPSELLAVDMLNNNDFEIVGMDAISAQPGVYEIAINLALLQKFNSGIAGNATVTANWTIPNLNNAPEANAGPDQLITQTETVVLDGSASLDADGALIYQWFAPAGISLSNPDAAIAQFEVNAEMNGQAFVFTLVVNDGILIDQDEVLITIQIATGEVDCAGILNGTATEDACGVCDDNPDNNNQSCSDCAGIVNGTASFDNCEICSGGTTGIEPCIADCNGDFGGTATTDLCGVCDANPDNDNATCSDCNGDVNGTAFLDGCDICVGGNTGAIPCLTAISLDVDWDNNCGSRAFEISIYQPGTNTLISTSNGILQSDGSANISVQLPSGNYDIYIRIDGYLSREISGANIDAELLNSLLLTDLIFGDLIIDDAVDMSDLTALLASFNTMAGDTLYEGIRDLNCDGVIDITDLTLLLTRYGMVGDIPGAGQ